MSSTAPPTPVNDALAELRDVKRELARLQMQQEEADVIIEELEQEKARLAAIKQAEQRKQEQHSQHGDNRSSSQSALSLRDVVDTYRPLFLASDEGNKSKSIVKSVSRRPKTVRVCLNGKWVSVKRGGVAAQPVPQGGLVAPPSYQPSVCTGKPYSEIIDAVIVPPGRAFVLPVEVCAGARIRFDFSVEEKGLGVAFSLRKHALTTEQPVGKIDQMRIGKVTGEPCCLSSADKDVHLLSKYEHDRTLSDCEYSTASESESEAEPGESKLPPEPASPLTPKNVKGPVYAKPRLIPGKHPAAGVMVKAGVDAARRRRKEKAQEKKLQREQQQAQQQQKQLQKEDGPDKQSKKRTHQKDDHPEAKAEASSSRNYSPSMFGLVADTFAGLIRGGSGGSGGSGGNDGGGSDGSHNQQRDHREQHARSDEQQRARLAALRRSYDYEAWDEMGEVAWSGVHRCKSARSAFLWGGALGGDAPGLTSFFKSPSLSGGGSADPNTMGVMGKKGIIGNTTPSAKGQGSGSWFGHASAPRSLTDRAEEEEEIVGGGMGDRAMVCSAGWEVQGIWGSALAPCALVFVWDNTRNYKQRTVTIKIGVFVDTNARASKASKTSRSTNSSSTSSSNSSGRSSSRSSSSSATVKRRDYSSLRPRPLSLRRTSEAGTDSSRANEGEVEETQAQESLITAPLEAACRNGDEAVVRVLIGTSPELLHAYRQKPADRVDRHGENSSEGNDSDDGDDSNDSDDSNEAEKEEACLGMGLSPLMHAAVGGHLRVMGTLLAAGANPTDRDDAGNTAADLARQQGHEDAAAALQDAYDHEMHLRESHG